MRELLANKKTRQNTADLLRLAFSPLSYVLALALVFYYRLDHANYGNCLYTLARRIS